MRLKARRAVTGGGDSAFLMGLIVFTNRVVVVSTWGFKVLLVKD